MFLFTKRLQQTKRRRLKYQFTANKPRHGPQLLDHTCGLWKMSIYIKNSEVYRSMWANRYIWELPTAAGCPNPASKLPELLTKAHLLLSLLTGYQTLHQEQSPQLLRKTTGQSSVNTVHDQQLQWPLTKYFPRPKASQPSCTGMWCN